MQKLGTGLNNTKLQNKIRILFARNPPDAFDECRHFPTSRPTVACPFPGWCVEVYMYFVKISTNLFIDYLLSCRIFKIRN